MVLVDLDGRLPSWDDIKTGIWNAIRRKANNRAWDKSDWMHDPEVSAVEVITDAFLNIGENVEDSLKSTWNNAIEGLSSCYEYCLEVGEEVTGIKTSNISLSGRVALGGSVSGGIGVTSDNSGNIAFQMTVAGGGGFAGIGGGLSYMFTDAPSYENLEGLGGVTGGSFALGIDLGYDSIFMDSYVGHSVSVGKGVNLPWTAFLEAHGEISYTVTLHQFNVYDILESLKFDDVSDCN